MSKLRNLTYVDDQSLGETHEMIVKALPGQSYVKEQLHKVSTTQVTGDSLMKVSVGGKGGFGSQGDVREQTKELNADVIRMEKKEVFKQRLEIMQSASEGKLDEPSSSEWIDAHYIRMKEKHGNGRDYFDFNYQSSCDARDFLNIMEGLYANQGIKEGMDLGKPFTVSQIHGGKPVTVTVDPNRRITKNELTRARNRYDEVCGYRGAWKHSDRRYKIVIENTLNIQPKPNTKPISEEVRQAQLRGAVQVWDQKMTHQMYSANSVNSPKDDARAMLEILDSYTSVNTTERWLTGLANTKVREKEAVEEAKPLTKAEQRASDWVRLRAETYNLPTWIDEHGIKRYGRCSEYFDDEIQPLLDNQGIDLRDWKLVYKWECTAKGKMMFV